MENNREKEDVFRESIDDAIKKQMAESTKSLVLNNPSLVAKIKERLEEGDTQWDLLRKMIDGSLTERFIEILMNMPDRDFARNYLKLLEHFKPKITRSEGGSESDNDLTVNIQMVVLNESGEKKVITVDEISEENENI